ncbi:hypothetical protein [Dysgonomonas sp. 520]|uniref:hypothetical protein n=1 Tax=Dysgonomonas sp. 520 TaxID=2302931 RepID=UPI0013D423D5|nr:hypothetical protein [Dysgonomonas sp. 520]
MIFLAVTALKAQVGVNTESPQGVFHIDAARNTSSNTNIADDVVVDAQGRVGVGTNAPQTKVDIRSGTINKGFRLQDGSQLAGRVLISDNDGNASWQQNVGNQSSLYRKLAASTASTVTLTTGVSNELPGVGTYTAVNSGKYLVFFHSFLHVPSTSAAGMKSFYFWIYRNGSPLSNDETYSYVTQGSVLNTHYSTVVSLNAGDVISFRVVAQIGAPLLITSSTAGRNAVEVIFLGI